MKSAINVICFLIIVFGVFFAGFGVARLYKQTLPDTKIRNIGETQQQLIDAGYGYIYVARYKKWCTLTVDYKWGPIMDAAYCAYMADKTLAKTETKQ